MKVGRKEGTVGRNGAGRPSGSAPVEVFYDELGIYGISNGLANTFVIQRFTQEVEGQPDDRSDPFKSFWSYNQVVTSRKPFKAGEIAEGRD